MSLKGIDNAVVYHVFLIYFKMVFVDVLKKSKKK